MKRPLPPEIADDFARAVRLEWWTVAWIGSVIVVMGAAAGASQAMRTAWIEDVLSLVPAIVFLIAARFERRPATPRFPFGFTRVHSLAFLISAVALAAVGVLLLVESAHTLIAGDHPTVAAVHLFGREVWQGWVMVAALIYSVAPPFVLGRLKQPVARRLQDKVLHTDALMQRADWMTGLAGVAGVIGLGLGWWWADASAAAIIAFSIVRDGWNALRTATAELVDGAPRALDSGTIAEDAQALHAAFAARYPGAEVRLRETGRYIHAAIAGVDRMPDDAASPADHWPGDANRAWRLRQVSFAPTALERDQPI